MITIGYSTKTTYIGNSWTQVTSSTQVGSYTVPSTPYRIEFNFMYNASNVQYDEVLKIGNADNQRFPTFYIQTGTIWHLSFTPYQAGIYYGCWNGTYPLTYYTSYDVRIDNIYDSTALIRTTLLYVNNNLLCKAQYNGATSYGMGVSFPVYLANGNPHTPGTCQVKNLIIGDLVDFEPSSVPTFQPSKNPTSSPSFAPSKNPTLPPTLSPQLKCILDCGCEEEEENLYCETGHVSSTLSSCILECL